MLRCELGGGMIAYHLDTHGEVVDLRVREWHSYLTGLPSYDVF